MPRAASLVLLALVPLALTACAVERRAPEPPPYAPAVAAGPQSARLDWVERFGSRGNRITFRVRSFAVLDDGWRAQVSLTNGTSVPLAVGERNASVDRVFGVMLFGTGDAAELERRNTAGELPAVRRADTIEPSLPDVLAPGATWSGTIGARGALAAGRFVRVVFGTLVPVGDPPPDYPDRLVWITDAAYELLPPRAP